MVCWMAGWRAFFLWHCLCVAHHDTHAARHPQSAFHNPGPFAAGGAGVGLFLSLLRNDFGDLFRALGLMLIYLLERNRQGAYTK